MDPFCRAMAWLVSYWCGVIAGPLEYALTNEAQLVILVIILLEYCPLCSRLPYPQAVWMAGL